MTTALPLKPFPTSMQWEPMDFGGTVSSVLGGTAQRVNRLGNRWQVTVSLPVLTPTQAREWSAALTAGLRSGVTWTIRQVGTPTGSPGTPLVAGVSQTGNTLDLDGLNPGYWIKQGQFFTLTTGGQAYVYQAAINVQADASGTATVTIEPPLRVTPADNDPVELGLPTIEGIIEPLAWSLDPDHLARGFSFTIMETR